MSDYLSDLFKTDKCMILLVNVSFHINIKDIFFNFMQMQVARPADP